MTIPSGVYCTTSQIQVSGGNITGNVTFVTPKFNISGANVTLTPYYQDLLIYATGANNSNWSGVGAGTSGTIYMPVRDHADRQRIRCLVQHVHRGEDGRDQRLLLEHERQRAAGKRLPGHSADRVTAGG
jgi:hypothetical protein